MKRLYEHFVSTGQTKRAEEILKIPRYAKFKDNSGEEKVEPKVETKSKKVK